MARWAPIRVLQGVGVPWRLSGRGSGTITATAGSGPNKATIIVDGIPDELLGQAGYLVGWVGVWKALLAKSGATDIHVSREEKNNTFVYQCSWNTRASA